ncbi:MAG: helix-turn-helix transcriptional regulator [Oscillospiraceae bacterium]|nr:helix-turn-helix transcriptional regulator [Oscillospiraceae bacterium]
MKNENTYFFTLSLLEEYLSSHINNGNEPLTFRDAIVGMREEGLLLTSGETKEYPDPEMDPQTFERVCMDFPWNVDHILSFSEEEYLDNIRQEDFAFPPGQSVFCHRLLPGLNRLPLRLDYFEIYCVVRGEIKLIFEDESFSMQEGDMCILPPQTNHGVSMEMGSIVEDVVLRASTLDSRFGELLTMSGVFSGFFREALYGSAQPNLLVLHTKPGDRRIDFCMRGLAAECYRTDKHSWSTTVCWVKLLLSNALRSCGDNVEIYRFPTGGNPRADCGEILQYIQQNYRTVRLSTLAQQFHYNETYLSRMLQNYAHQSFTEIVREIRMNRAVEYLVSSSLRIHEIAGLVGYSSVDHFSRAFKATYGISPQRYRREKRKQ